VRSSIDHLSEVDLIRYIDQEMSPDEDAAARLHLETCDLCQADLQEITAVGEEVSQIFAGSPGAPETTVPRISLERKLAEENDQAALSNNRVPLWIRNKVSTAYIGGTAGLLAIAALFFILPNPGRSNAEMAASLPNRALTPGMTRQVELVDICREGDDDLDPAVPAPRKEAVFREYGMSPDHAANDYQVDYLISPQLGGTDDVRNLWPQSYKETTWNAEAKDALERHLYQLVCERKITLQEAQHAIAHDWIAAYQKYF
jgi:hypothetical protein